MAINKHQLLHLTAIKNEQIYDKKDPVMMEKLRQVKAKTEVGYNNYIDNINTDVDVIIASGVWPNQVKEPSDIHDYLEGTDQWLTRK